MLVARRLEHLLQLEVLSDLAIDLLLEMASLLLELERAGGQLGFIIHEVRQLFLGFDLLVLGPLFASDGLLLRMFDLS